MKKIIIIFTLVLLTTTCAAFAAKYKVNTSGNVKSNGKTVSPVSVMIINPYNTYNTNTYINNNQVNANQINTIEIVMDYSGSMSNWINEAKRAMASIISQIPASTNLGFRVFGQNHNGLNPYNNSTLASVKKIVKTNCNKYKAVTQNNAFLGNTFGFCSATAQVSKISPANSSSILAGMNSVTIGGSTPLVYGLDRAIYQDFSGLPTNYLKKIVLITDGGENCGGNPCEFARDLMNKRSDVSIDVIIVGSDNTKLSCVSSTTGGHLYNVKNLSSFSSVLTKSITAPKNQIYPQNTIFEIQKYEFYDN